MIPGQRQRVRLKSPVREYRPPGSVRGVPGNRCPYLDSASGPGESNAEGRGPADRNGAGWGVRDIVKKVVLEVFTCSLALEACVKIAKRGCSNRVSVTKPIGAVESRTSSVECQRGTPLRSFFTLNRFELP